MNWVRKFSVYLAALTGASGVVISSGLLSGTSERWVSAGLAAASAFVVVLLHDPSPPSSTVRVDDQPQNPVSSQGQNHSPT